MILLGLMIAFWFILVPLALVFIIVLFDLVIGVVSMVIQLCTDDKMNDKILNIIDRVRSIIFLPMDAFEWIFKTQFRVAIVTAFSVFTGIIVCIYGEVNKQNKDTENCITEFTQTYSDGDKFYIVDTNNQCWCLVNPKIDENGIIDLNGTKIVKATSIVCYDKATVLSKLDSNTIRHFLN